jgi:hypothetical protein
VRVSLLQHVGRTKDGGQDELCTILKTADSELQGALMSLLIFMLCHKFFFFFLEMSL